MDKEKEKKILDKLKEEERESVMMTGFIRERVFEFLTARKGYAETDIELDAPFVVETERARDTCSVDFIVSLGGKRLIAIKCAPSALESRERHILAFSRVMDCIPFSVVTDSICARVLKTDTGELLSEDLSSLPGRSEALSMLENPGKEKKPSYPEEKLKKERCILLAFNAIRCSVPNACPSGKGNGVKTIPLKFK